MEFQTPTSNQDEVYLRRVPPKLKKKTGVSPHVRAGFHGRRKLVLEDPNVTQDSSVNQDPNVEDPASHSPSCPLGPDAATGGKCQCFTPIKQD